MAYTEKYMNKVKDIIIEDMCEGNSLKSILDTKKDMPTRATVYTWLNDAHNKFDKKFLNNYVRATQERAEYIFDEMMGISDTTEQGTTTKETEKGLEVTTGDMINHRRLKVETRKWVLGRMNPKKYSDKIQVDTTEFSEQPLFPNVPKNNSNK